MVPNRSQPSAEQLSPGGDWNHVLRGGRVVKVPPVSPPRPTTSPVAEASIKAQMSSTSKKASSKKPAPEVSAAP